MYQHVIFTNTHVVKVSSSKYRKKKPHSTNICFTVSIVSAAVLNNAYKDLQMIGLVVLHGLERWCLG